MIKYLQCHFNVKIFLLDIIMGSITSLFGLLLIFSIFVIRNRREAGPVLMLISSLSGIAGSTLFLLDRLQVLEISGAMILIPFILWFIIFTVSVLMWRKR